MGRWWQVRPTQMEALHNINNTASVDAALRDSERIVGNPEIGNSKTR